MRLQWMYEEITKLHIATAYHALSIVVIHLMRWFLVVHLMQLIVANCPWFGALKPRKLCIRFLTTTRI